MKITQPHHDPLLEQLRLFNESAQALTRQWSLTEDDGNHPIVALPQKSDYSTTFGANCISAPKVNLTDETGVQRQVT
jgi:hypothetical protein